MKALKVPAKIVVALLLLVVLAMFIVPFFYKDKIKEMAKTEMNNQLNARVDFSDLELSLFRGFPDFSIGLTSLSVVNLPEDTLLQVDGLYVTVGLMSVFRNEPLEIISVLIDSPNLSLKVNERGSENWDIVKETEKETETVKENNDPMVFLLKKLEIRNGNFTYRDDESHIMATLQDFNGFLKGEFNEDRTDMTLKLQTDDVSVIVDEVMYLTHAVVRMDAVVDANLEDEIYNLKNNSIYLNGLRLNFEGSVAYVNDDLSLMLVYNAPDNSFRQLLSLIPAVYQQDYEKLNTTGNFTMDGYVKGVYSEDKIPDFKLDTKVSGAEISYEGMPASINEIAFDLLVDSKGNNLDNMVMKLDKFTGSIGKDKIKFDLMLTNLISDPYIDTKISAGLHLDNLKQIFPQEELSSLSGELLADFTVKGHVSAAENNDYKNMLAMGSLIANALHYNDPGNYPVDIRHAQFNFSPSQIDIIGFDSKINGNNLTANGKIENYLSYFLKDDLFTGTLQMQSNKLGINKLLEPWSSEGGAGTSEPGSADGSTREEITYIPENLDVVISLKADTVVYQKLVFTDFNSKVHVHEGKVDFEAFNSDFLGGLINLQGFYVATPDIEPHIDFNLNLKDMNVSQAYQNLTVFEKFAPIAEKAKGIFSSTLTLSTNLDSQMNPVWTSILGSGKFTSDNIELSAEDIAQKISKAIKVNLFNNPSTGPVDLKFKILDGKLYNGPFHVAVNGVDVEVGGWTGFNQQIDYNLAFNIPVKLLGDQVAGVMDQYASVAAKYGVNLGDVQTLKPVVAVTGNFNNPQVRLVSIGNTSGGSVKDLIEDRVEEIVDIYAEKANEEAKKIIAKAQRQADSVMSVAQTRADQVMQLARQSVKDAKAETQVQADQLVKEAAKQGPVAELAAKKAAQELLKNADVQADKVLQKAQQESDNILEKARQQSDAIMQQAQEKADKIRK